MVRRRRSGAAPAATVSLRPVDDGRFEPGAEPEEGTSAAQWVSVGRLAVWDKNPRRNDAAVEPVKGSIEAFGFGAPIVARRANGFIIAGHTRLKSALARGMSRVPVRFLDIGQEAAERLALADNRTGEFSNWDDRRLVEVLSEQPSDVRALIGWSEQDYATLLRRAAPSPAPDALVSFTASSEKEVHVCPRCRYEWTDDKKKK
jgi:ParB-like chromosome segregation protein Spo0J